MPISYLLDNLFKSIPPSCIHCDINISTHNIIMSEQNSIYDVHEVHEDLHSQSY